MRGHVLVAVAAGAVLAACSSAFAGHAAAVRFKVVSAKATAMLTFHQENSDQSNVFDGTATLVVTNKGTGGGTLGGTVLAPIRGTGAERVKIKRRASPTSPYQEQTCSRTRAVSGKGGLRLRKSGNKVEVLWAFPQARVGFCPGTNVGPAITGGMKRVYPVSLFSKSRFTLVLAGSDADTTVPGSNRLTYTWRATVKLAKTS